MCKDNKKTYGLLACLMWLLLASQESAAAQENLLSTQRLLAPPGGFKLDPLNRDPVINPGGG